MFYEFDSARKNTDLASETNVKASGSSYLDHVSGKEDLSEGASCGAFALDQDMENAPKGQSGVFGNLGQVEEISLTTQNIVTSASDSDDPSEDLTQGVASVGKTKIAGKSNLGLTSQIGATAAPKVAPAIAEEAITTATQADDPGEGVLVGSAKSGARQVSNAYIRRVRQALFRGATTHEAAAAAQSGIKAVAATGTKAGAGAAAAGGAAGSAGGGPVLAAIGIIVGALLLFMVSLVILTSLLGVCQPKANYDLTDVENRMIDRLRYHGFDDVHIAAILGNSKAESNNEPDSDSGVSGGLFHWDSGNYTAFKQAAAEAGVDWRTDVEWQIDYFVGKFKSMWVGSRAHNYWAYWTDFSGVTSSWSDWEACTDPKTGAFIFMAGFEGCSYGYQAHLDRRVEYAQMFYDAIMAGSKGQQYAQAEGWQRNIVDACYATPWPGPSYCLKWVNDVYDRAGMSFPRYPRACDVWEIYCHSSDRADLEVGMVIAVPSTVTSPTIGHIGIYIGDGKVMDSIGSGVRTQSLDDWCGYYGSMVRWGFPW